MSAEYFRGRNVHAHISNFSFCIYIEENVVRWGDRRDPRSSDQNTSEREHLEASVLTRQESGRGCNTWAFFMARSGFEMLDIEAWEHGKSALFGTEPGPHILLVVALVWPSAWMDD